MKQLNVILTMLLILMAKPLSAQQKDSPINTEWSVKAKSDDLSGYTWKGKTTTQKPVQFTKEQLDWLRKYKQVNSQQPVKEEVVIINYNTPTTTKHFMTSDEFNELFKATGFADDINNAVPHVIGSSTVPSMPKSSNYSRTITVTSTTKGSTTSSNIRLW